MTSEITPTREAASGIAPTSATIDFQTLFAQAIEQGKDPAQIVALFERMEDRAKDAERKGAIADARAKFTPIGQRRATNNTKTARDGRVLAGGYAKLEDIQEMVDPIFSDHGLDYRWGYVVADGKSWLVFYVTHRNGTEEERSRTEYMPDNSGSKSPSQARGSGESYAMRYTMRMGLSVRFTDACSEDDDAAEPADTITEEQGMELDAKLNESGSDTDRFYAAFGIERLRDFPAARFGEAVGLLNRKIKAKAKKGAE